MFEIKPKFLTARSLKVNFTGRLENQVLYILTISSLLISMVKQVRLKSNNQTLSVIILQEMQQMFEFIHRQSITHLWKGEKKSLNIFSICFLILQN